MTLNKKDELKNKTYKFSVKVTNFVSGFPNKRTYWVLGDQLLRSATSIGANIIEAQAAASKKDFINFFQIALKSANETTYWLRLLKDTTNINKNQVNLLIEEAITITNLLGASLLTLKGKRKRKQNF